MAIRTRARDLVRKFPWLLDFGVLQCSHCLAVASFDVVGDIEGGRGILEMSIRHAPRCPLRGGDVGTGMWAATVYEVEVGIELSWQFDPRGV